jgi:hypothetical protein
MTFPLRLKFLKTYFNHYFFSNTHNGNAILSFDNSTALYKDLKTLHPGGIRTRDLLFCRRTRWPLCHAGRHSDLNSDHIALLFATRANFFYSGHFMKFTFVTINYVKENLRRPTLDSTLLKVKSAVIIMYLQLCKPRKLLSVENEPTAHISTYVSRP